MGRLAALAARVANTPVGRRSLGAVAVHRPDLLVGALGWRLARDAHFSAIAHWPDSVSEYDSVAPLVHTSGPANRGLASMSLAETALLWRLARQAGDAPIFEIGRERGESTFRIAAAMSPNGRLYSYDPQEKLGDSSLDRELEGALDRFGLADRVELSNEDSHTVEPPRGDYTRVLVDGDPSLAGTRMDHERFCTRLRAGGHALFHDAANGGPRERQLAPLMEEIAAGSAFERQPIVGTFMHFVKR